MAIPRQGEVNKKDRVSVPLLIGLFASTILFTLILRGQSIFDEYLHLPLISTMAAGDIPPHFYLNPQVFFAYHYAIQVFASSLVRLSHFFPWSAWDLSRALALGFTLVLSWSWVRNVTRSRLAAWLGAFLFAFAGGTRWLMLLLPSSWLNWVSQGVTMAGSGLATAPSLAEALHSSWVIEGAGPVPFPFAYHNGIFVPTFFTLGGSAALPFLIVFLLLILLPREYSHPAVLVTWSVIFATLALSAEHVFAIVWAGLALSLLIAFIFRKRLYRSLPASYLKQWLGILLLTAVLVVLQGGFITDTVRNIFTAWVAIPLQSYNAGRFSLRWPPGYPSAHYGSLSLNNPRQLVVLLAELGPVILTVPFLFIRFSKNLQRRQWFIAGLSLSVVIGLLIPLLIRYEVDRDLARMISGAMWLSLVMSFPILWKVLPHLHPAALVGISLVMIICTLGGLVIFRVQLYSIKSPQYASYIDGLDAGFLKSYWDKLPEDAQVLDSLPERAVTLFGRAVRSSSGLYDPLASWQSVIADPDPAAISAAGYDYVYFDRPWWDGLTSAQRAAYQQPCVEILDKRQQDNHQNFRILFDVSACQASP